jgi:hypothetical protein
MITPIQSLPGQKSWKEYGLDDLRRMAALSTLSAPPIHEQADSEFSALMILRKALCMPSGTEEIQVTTPLEIVRITHGNLFHLIEKRDNARERYADYILPTLQNPIEIWGTAYNDGSTRNRYIGLFTGKTDIAVIVKVEPDGSIMWNMMNADRARMNRFREGELLWKK